MSDFGRAFHNAVAAQREVFDLTNRLESAYATRDKAVARAWRSRPGGMVWRELLDQLNASLPAGAAVAYSTLRRAQRQGGGS